jgi:hypothetical protein
MITIITQRQYEIMLNNSDYVVTSEGYGLHFVTCIKGVYYSLVGNQSYLFNK